MAILLMLCLQDADELVQRLGHESIEERNRAEIELLRLGRKAEAALRKSHDDAEIRSRAERILRAIPFCEALGFQIGREFCAAADRIAVLLKHKPADVEEKTGRMIADAIFEGFAWRTEYDDSQHQSELFDLREKLKDGPQILSWVFVRMMEHPHPYVRLHGVVGLGEMKAKDRVKFVLPLLKDANDYSRMRAAEAIGAFGAKEHAAAVEALLADAKPEVRWSAWTALAQFGRNVADALKDADAGVRARAASHLDDADRKDALVALKAALAAEKDKGAAHTLESAVRSLEMLQGTRRPIKPTTSWSGDNSKIETPGCFRVTSEAAWVEIWKKHSDEEAPKVDFSTSMVIAIFQGKGWNSNGVTLVSLTEDDESSYQTMGGGERVTTFGIFVIAKSDKPMILEENVQSLIMGSPVWKERARLP